VATSAHARLRPQPPAGRPASHRVAASGPGLSAATCDYLSRARATLDEAATSLEPASRYAGAHMAALQATAGLLAARAQPAPQRGQRSAWALLVRVAPELGEWASFFAAGASKRAAAEAGLSGAVTAREADDLLRDSERFLGLVERFVAAPQQRLALAQEWRSRAG
jgi:SAV_6107-like HEPN